MRDAGLAGRLADFTLEEILQLIALQQKTGLLTVDASYPMVLAFEGGMLVGYRDMRRVGIDPLESFLKRYGFFDSGNWEHIDFVQKHSKLDLTEILVNEGLFEAEELEQVQFDAAQEDIFRGMQLRDGRYHFTPGRDGMAGLKGRIRVKVDGLLMEAVRRIDEIAGLHDRYFSPDLRVRIGDSAVEPETRGRLEQRLLAIIHDKSTLGEVISKAKMAEFDVISTLEHLRGEGIVSIQTTPKATPKADASAARKAIREERVSNRPWITSATALTVALVLAVFQPWSDYRSSTVEASPGQQYHQARSRAHVEAAVQLFVQERQRPPSNLSELGEDGWLDAAALRDAERQFVYTVHRNSNSWSLRLSAES